MVTAQSIPAGPSEPLICRQCKSQLEMGANFCPGCGAPTQGEAAPDPLVGQVVADRYKILQLVGRGGMGVVYKCEHTRMGKLMAIKLLHGELARDQEVQRRFRREAQAVSRLSHPATVGIFDFGMSEGLMYLVMEYVPGEDLGRLLRVEGRIAPERAAALLIQACSSLGEAHDVGIVHRDIKPENLLVTRLKDGRETIKLLDFGLAKLREGEERNEITAGNVLIGTPYYMAPEVIRGHSADHRADIYALGALLYRAITGTPPFTGGSPVAVLTKHLTDDLVPPSKRRPDYDIPVELDGIVARCMAKDPGERYPHVDGLRADLTAFLEAHGSRDLLIDSEIITGAAISTSGARKSAVATDKFVVATRSDVEAFERGLRRRSLAGWLSFLLVIAGAAIGGFFIYRSATRGGAGPRDSEQEPNHQPHNATPIAPGVQVHGQIGRRLTSTQGDVDLFRLPAITSSRQRVRVELQSQPNIDSVVELLRQGQSSAVFVADDGSTGVREVIAGFALEPGQYYVSVHERVRPGEIPQENISDDYVLRFSIETPAADDETEPDDRREIARDVDPPVTMRGWIESRDDVDWYCLRSAPAATRITLTPPPDMDLELVVSPRDGAADRSADNAQGGGVESQLVETAPGARAPCVAVRGSQAHRLDRGDPDRSYTLRIEPR